MTKEKFSFKGTPTFTLRDSNGDIINQFTKKNLIVNTGVDWIVARMVGSSTDKMSHIAIGNGNSTPIPSNVTLDSETLRKSVDVLGGTKIASAIKLTVTYSPGQGSGTISEAGVFTANTGGVMISRVVFTPFVKAAADTLEIEWIFEAV